MRRVHIFFQNRARLGFVLQNSDNQMFMPTVYEDMILDTCDRVILISGGRIAADGPAKEILSNKELLEANRMELPLRMQ
jgi:cobalt/nickel transport system ATP-binding protein